MMGFVFSVVVLSALVFFSVKKVINNDSWGYRGEFLIVASCLYFIGIFTAAELSLKKYAKEQIYQCEITSDFTRLVISKNESIAIPIRIKNLSRNIIKIAEDPPIMVSYHLLDYEKRNMSYENIRTALHKPLNPDETLSVNLQVSPISETGIYFIEIDCVYETKYWFKEWGGKTLMCEIEVK